MLYLLLCNWQISLKIHDEIKPFNRFSIRPFFLLLFYCSFFYFYFFLLEDVFPFLSFLIFVCSFSVTLCLYILRKKRLPYRASCVSDFILWTYFFSGEVSSCGCLSSPSPFRFLFSVDKIFSVRLSRHYNFCYLYELFLNLIHNL